MKRPTGGLGRGLSSLIPGADDPASGASVRDVSVDHITPNPYQPRHRVDQAALEELAASIREHGLLQPLIVTAQGGQYQLIAGERRWRAARLAGLATVPVIVKEATPQARLELALVENIQRADLDVLEEAAAYEQLVIDFGLTHDQIAARVGRSRTSVTNTIRLLKLAAPVREALAEGRISPNHARALLPLRDEAQLAVLKMVEREDLTARQTEILVKGLLESQEAAPPPFPPSPPPPPPSRETLEIQERFTQALNTKVDLVRGKSGGRLVIHFYSDEELQALYDALVRE